MKTTDENGLTKSSNLFVTGLHQLWSNFQNDKYDRLMIAVGVAEALGFLLAAVLATGACGCYALTGQPLGGNNQEPSPCEGMGDDCVYVSNSPCPKGDFHCIYKPNSKDVDAGPPDVCGDDTVCKGCVDKDVPHAKWTDGGCAGQCYADVCTMPKECPDDAPPVCWWLCPKFKKIWKVDGNKGVTPVSYDPGDGTHCKPEQCYLGAANTGWCISPGDNGPYVSPPPPATPTHTMELESDGSFIVWCADCRPEKHHWIAIE